MKSILVKTALVAASTLAVGAFASAASAKTYEYTFVGHDGTVYCDGLTVSTSDKLHYAGAHTGCDNDLAAAGFASKIKGYVPVVNIATQDTSAETETFLFSSKVMAWELWIDRGGVFTMVNYGPLQDGPPAAAKPGQHGHPSSASAKGPQQAPAGQGLRWNQ